MRLPQYKFVVLFFLYVAQAVPMSFFQTAVPVYLRQRGVDLATLGALSILALPAALRFLWAPLVDSKGLQKFGNYKSWIVPLQLFTIAIMPLMTTFDWVANFRWFVVLVFLMTVIGATQDTAVDGLVIRALSHNEKPTGAALSNFSVLIGMALGGGIMIALFSAVGLNGSLWIMSAVYALPLLFLLPYKEPPLEPTRRPATYRSLIEIFRRREVRRWMLHQTLLLAGIALGTGLMIPMLVDQGYQMASFGLLNGVLFPIVGAIGTILAPIAIRRFGRERVILVAASFLTLHILDLIAIQQLRPPLPVTFALLSFLGFTNVFLFIGIYSVAMDLARPESAATDWTIQSGILTATGLVFAGIAGVIAQRFGYGPLLAIALAVNLGGIWAVRRYFASGSLAAVHVPPPAAFEAVSQSGG
jgi:MFS family permease